MRAPSASLRHGVGAQAGLHEALRDLREVFKEAVMWAVKEWGETAPEAIAANGLNDEGDNLAGRMTPDERSVLASTLRREAAQWAIGQGAHPEEAIRRHGVTSGSTRDHLRFLAASREVRRRGLEPVEAIALFKVRGTRRQAVLRAMGKPVPAPRPARKSRR